MKTQFLLRWIAAVVVSAHLFFLCWLGWISPERVPVSAPSPRLVVQTINVKEPLLALAEPPLPPQPSETDEFPVDYQKEEPLPEEVQPLPAIPPPQKPKPVERRVPPESKKPKWKAPVPQIDEAPKKSGSKAAPKVVGKKETHKKATDQVVAKKSEPKKPQNEALKKLLASAEESIAKIDKNRDKGSTSPTKAGAILPGKIEKLQIDAVGNDRLTGTEASYRDELSIRLKRLLRLPEFGEVKLKLTLERTGRVANITVLNSQSTLNRTYIESTLPTLKFIDFGKNFSGENNYTFIINLTNE